MKNVKGTLKWIVCCMLVCLIAAFAVIILTPAAPIRDISAIESVAVYKVVNGQLVDVTDKVDNAALKRALPLLRKSRYSSGHTTTAMADEKYEMTIIYNCKPIHVVVGSEKRSYVYRSSNRGMAYLIDPDSWAALLQALSGETQ